MVKREMGLPPLVPTKLHTQMHTITLPEGFDTLTDIERYHVLQSTLRRSGYELAGLTLPGHIPITTGQCGNNWLPVVRTIKQPS